MLGAHTPFFFFPDAAVKLSIIACMFPSPGFRWRLSGRLRDKDA